MQETENNQLFTDLSTKESATINGGHRYYRHYGHRGYYNYGYPGYYRRPVRYYSHHSYSRRPYHHPCY